MKCELTRKEVCYLWNYRNLFISVSECCKRFNSKEEFEGAIKNKKEKMNIQIKGGSKR